MNLKQLKHTKTVDTQSGEPIELKYYLVLNITNREYGIAVRSVCGSRKEQALFSAVTPDCAKAESLLQKLADGAVTPVTLADVVQDWL